MAEPYHNSRRYFKILDNMRELDSRSLDVTIREDGKPDRHFIQPPRDNLKFPYSTQEVNEQILANNLRDSHAETQARKAAGKPPMKLGQGKNKHALKHPKGG